MDNYSEDKLLSFLDYVGKKGLMNETTANSRRIAAQKILSVLDPSEKADLRNLNREELNTRFINKYGRDFTPGSLVTYRQRFAAALDDFLKYVENPAAFKVSAVPRAARQAVRDGGKEPNPVVRRVRFRDGSRAPGLNVERSDAAPARRAQELLSYPIPLPSGEVAQLSVPSRISTADADRINTFVSAMVKALATDE
jgi:hypothetical protein